MLVLTVVILLGILVVGVTVEVFNIYMKDQERQYDEQFRDRFNKRN